MLSLILSALCLTSCSERIDAGSEGILVNLYGSDKGVDDVSLVTGRVWYNPFTEEVYEYPTFVQTIDYPAFTINAKDGSEFTVDPTVSLKMVDGNAPRVFKKYRKELKDIVNGTLFNYVKDAFRIQLNKYTTDQIVSNRDLVERAIEAQLSKALAREHFHLEQLTSGLKYPSSIVEAVSYCNHLNSISPLLSIIYKFLFSVTCILLAKFILLSQHKSLRKLFLRRIYSF